MRVSLYMAALLERFRDHVARLGLFPRPGAALVAVSGGPDSVALLDLMSAVAGELGLRLVVAHADHGIQDRKSTRLNSSHLVISYAVFCLKKEKKESTPPDT